MLKSCSHKQTFTLKLYPSIRTRSYVLAAPRQRKRLTQYSHKRRESLKSLGVLSLPKARIASQCCTLEGNLRLSPERVAFMMLQQSFGQPYVGVRAFKQLTVPRFSMLEACVPTSFTCKCHGHANSKKKLKPNTIAKKGLQCYGSCLGKPKGTNVL